MAMKVLHNTCNMCISDLPDMNALIPPGCNPWALQLGIHIRQIPHAHVAAITHNIIIILICITSIVITLSFYSLIGI